MNATARDDGMEARKGRAKAWFEQLRDDICAAFETLEDALDGENAARFAEVAPGRFEVASLQATAGFRYAKWMRPLVETYGVRAVISKGGVSQETYRELGDRFGVVFLTTVGYGLGAIYGRAVKRVRAVHWKEQLGISEAMWVLECERLGPLLVEGDQRLLFPGRAGKGGKTVGIFFDERRPIIFNGFGRCIIVPGCACCK